MIKKYVLDRTLPVALFPLNQQGVHRVAAYWDSGVFLEDYTQPWVMTKEINTGLGFHPILTDTHHYMH